MAKGGGCNINGSRAVTTMRHLRHLPPRYFLLLGRYKFCSERKFQHSMLSGINRLGGEVGDFYLLGGKFLGNILIDLHVLEY